MTSLFSGLSIEFSLAIVCFVTLFCCWGSLLNVIFIKENNLGVLYLPFVKISAFPCVCRTNVCVCVVCLTSLSLTSGMLMLNEAG